MKGKDLIEKLKKYEDFDIEAVYSGEWQDGDLFLNIHYRKVDGITDVGYSDKAGYSDKVVVLSLNDEVTVPVRHGKNKNQKYHEVDEFRCSECGLHLEDWTRYVYDEDSDEEYAQEYVFKRCPECGAKIGVQ